MKLYTGIDVSSKKLDVCYLDSSDKKLKQDSLGNDIFGALAIKGEILRLHEKHNYERIVIGMESTSVYSFHPSTFLNEDDDLKALGCVEVVVLNPTPVHRYKKLFNTDKNDTVDAFHIADYLRIERFQTSLLREEKYVALQRLTRARFAIVGQMTEAKQHFLENLYYKCNTLTKELKDNGSTSVFGAAMMDILTDELTLDEIAEMEINGLVELLQSKGKGRFGNPEKLAKTIKSAIRGAYRLGSVVMDSVDAILRMYAELIKFHKKQIKAIEKSIEALFESIPEAQCLLSIPGVGKVYAAGIIAEIGQIERFEDQAKLAKYAGLYWKQNQSGDFESEHTPMTRTGNHYLRYYLIEAANSIRIRDSVYAAYYKKKSDEVPKYKHKRALVLTARKFVRLVDTLLRNRQLFTQERSV